MSEKCFECPGCDCPGSDCPGYLYPDEFMFYEDYFDCCDLLGVEPVSVDSFWKSNGYSQM